MECRKFWQSVSHVDAYDITSVEPPLLSNCLATTPTTAAPPTKLCTPPTLHHKPSLDTYISLFAGGVVIMWTASMSTGRIVIRRLEEENHAKYRSSPIQNRISRFNNSYINSTILIIVNTNKNSWIHSSNHKRNYLMSNCFLEGTK